MSEWNRRSFVGTAAAGAFTIVPRRVLGGAGFVPPSDKVTMAHIGMGTQGFAELGDLLADPKIQIVAVCDPNKESSDYVEWGKGSVRRRLREYLGDPGWRANDDGAPGGREVGRLVVDTYYAKQRGADGFKACAAYADFRELLEKERDVDAVKVMTPDHLHAAICLAAMKKGKHVMVHKPLANRMHEARLVTETARKTKVSTHLMAYGSGRPNERVAAFINQGAIGTLREIHNWSNRPVWPQYTEIPAEKPPAPEGFDWDLWLGPSLDRPYHPHYTHTVFRGWYEFGGGSMADMGIYSLWQLFVALDLDSPVSAEAWASHVCKVIDQVSRPFKNDFSYPAACTLRFRVPPKNGPAIELFWYDGGMRPRLPDEIASGDFKMGIEGILFVGDKGYILAGFRGEDAVLYANGKREPLLEPEPRARRGGGQRQYTDERHRAWRDAIHGGPHSPGSFLNAGAISDAVNLGTVALRAGKKVEFDSAQMRITNDEAANKYLYREYRKGWELS